jgi:hypothetical protein
MKILERLWIYVCCHYLNRVNFNISSGNRKKIRCPKSVDYDKKTERLER